MTCGVTSPGHGSPARAWHLSRATRMRLDVRLLGLRVPFTATTGLQFARPPTPVHFYITLGCKKRLDCARPGKRNVLCLPRSTGIEGGDKGSFSSSSPSLLPLPRSPHTSLPLFRQRLSLVAVCVPSTPDQRIGPRTHTTRLQNQLRHSRARARPTRRSLPLAP